MIPVLGRRLRIVCAVLQVLPAGLGAIIAGARNPHTPLLRNGIWQMALFVLGSWPLVLPGLVGLAWALWDLRLILAARPPDAWSQATGL